jgi:hypothetical protein
MTITPHAVLLALAASLLVAGPAAAGEGATRADAVVTHVEASPPMLLLQGMGVEAGVKLRGHLELGAAAFTLVIPEAFQGDNKDEDWDIRDSGGGVSARWFHRDDGRGLFLGGTLEVQNHHLARGRVDGLGRGRRRRAARLPVVPGRRLGILRAPVALGGGAALVQRGPRAGR